MVNIKSLQHNHCPGKKPADKLIPPKANQPLFQSFFSPEEVRLNH